MTGEESVVQLSSERDLKPQREETLESRSEGGRRINKRKEKGHLKPRATFLTRKGEVISNSLTVEEGRIVAFFQICEKERGPLRSFVGSIGEEKKANCLKKREARNWGGGGGRVFEWPLKEIKRGRGGRKDVFSKKGKTSEEEKKQTSMRKRSVKGKGKREKKTPREGEKKI